MIYLFIGQDSLSKDAQLAKIKIQLFTHSPAPLGKTAGSAPSNVKSENKVSTSVTPLISAKDIEQFNLDILYARELNLKTLQEKLLCLPFKAKSRLVVVKEAASLKEEIKDFILEYAKKDQPGICLVLDIDKYSPRDEFIKHLAKYSKIVHFKEAQRLDAFTLSRAIEQRRADRSLAILNQLLESGEKPERILGGLRYAWERNIAHPLETRKRLKLLLNCDIEIKTGKLKPGFALEKAVVSLCCMVKS